MLLCIGFVVPVTVDVDVDGIGINTDVAAAGSHTFRVFTYEEEEDLSQASVVCVDAWERFVFDVDANRNTVLVQTSFFDAIGVVLVDIHFVYTAIGAVVLVYTLALVIGEMVFVPCSWEVESISDLSLRI